MFIHSDPLTKSLLARLSRSSWHWHCRKQRLRNDDSTIAALLSLSLLVAILLLKLSLSRDINILIRGLKAVQFPISYDAACDTTGSTFWPEMVSRLRLQLYTVTVASLNRFLSFLHRLSRERMLLAIIVKLPTSHTRLRIKWKNNTLITVPKRRQQTTTFWWRHWREAVKITSSCMSGYSSVKIIEIDH